MHAKKGDRYMRISPPAACLQDWGLEMFIAVEAGSMWVMPFSVPMMKAVRKAHVDANGDDEAEELLLQDMHDVCPDGYKLLELQYEPGEVVLVHGMCVRAGAAGKAGQSALRARLHLARGDMVGPDGHVVTRPVFAEHRIVVAKLGFAPA